jgi:hypothetical protein
MLTKDRQLGERSIPLRASVPFSPRSHLGMKRSKVRSAASPSKHNSPSSVAERAGKSAKVATMPGKRALISMPLRE